MSAAAAAASPAVESVIAPMSRAVIVKRIFSLAGPTAVLAALQIVAQLAETWLAARQGTGALAGWAVVLPFSLLLQQMSAGAMGGGVVSSIARALGGKRRDLASASVVHALLIALIGGSLFAIALAIFPRQLLGAIAGPETAAAAIVYSTWLFGAGAIPVWLANTLASVLRGGGRHDLAATVLGATWLIYTPTAWFFAEPLGFGLAGIGMALALVFWVSAMVMAVVVWRGGAGFRPTLRVPLTAALFKGILAVGLTACVLASVANLTTILVTALIADHGKAAVAGYGISARLEFLMIPLAFGVGSALTALVGGAVGAGDWVNARRIAWTGGLMAFAATGLTGLAVGLMPATFAGWFTSDPQVAGFATRALAYIGPGFSGFGLGMALYFASMGANRMGGPSLAALCRIALAVGGGWCLSRYAGMGLDGQFLGVALGITAFGVVTASSVRRAIWSARV